MTMPVGPIMPPSPPIDGFGINLADVSLVLPKKRNTHHWKAIAKAAQAAVAERQTEIDAAERLADDRLAMLEAMSDALVAERKANAALTTKLSKLRGVATLCVLLALAVGLAVFG